MLVCYTIDKSRDDKAPKREEKSKMTLTKKIEEVHFDNNIFIVDRKFFFDNLSCYDKRQIISIFYGLYDGDTGFFVVNSVYQNQGGYDEETIFYPLFLLGVSYSIIYGYCQQLDSETVLKLLSNKPFVTVK